MIDSDRPEFTQEKWDSLTEETKDWFMEHWLWTNYKLADRLQAFLEGDS